MQITPQASLEDWTAAASRKECNARIVSVVADIKRQTSRLRAHLSSKYAGIREWLGEVRPSA